MTKKIEIELEDCDYEEIIHFKKVFDVVTEEDNDLNSYMIALIGFGFDEMLKRTIPQDMDVLWKTIVAINKKDPKSFADFAIAILKKGDDRVSQAKEKLKERLSYIT